MRALQPLAAGLWIWFLIWTLLVAVLWLTGFGEGQAIAWLQTRYLTPEQAAEGVTPHLQAPLLTILRLADPLWIVLAVANAYACLVRERGLATARHWMLLLLGSAFAIALASAWTALPLGPIHFTTRLGSRLGPVSLGWILLWCTVILGARELARLLLPRATHGATALATGCLALATDLNIEPVAWKIRAFWLWYPGQLPAPDFPPLQNYATWLLGAAALAYYFRAPEVIRPSPTARPLPGAAVILLILNILCLATHLIYRLRA